MFRRDFVRSCSIALATFPSSMRGMKYATTESAGYVVTYPARTNEV